MYIKLSIPRFNSSAISLMFCDLFFRLIRYAAKCSFFNIICSLLSKIFHTSFSLFLLHKASSIPSLRFCSMKLCSALKDSATSTSPSVPSPHIPLHKVLSQSSTITLKVCFFHAHIFRATKVPITAKYSSVNGMCPALSVDLSNISPISYNSSAKLKSTV